MHRFARFLPVSYQVASICTIALSLVCQTVSAQTVTASGNITDPANAAVNGATVLLTVQGAAANQKKTSQNTTSDNKGNYKVTTATASTAANLNYSVWAYLLTNTNVMKGLQGPGYFYDQYTFTGQKAFNGGNKVANPGNGNDAPVTVNIKLANFTATVKTNPGVGRSLQVSDPTYTFTSTGVHTGLLNFTDDSDASSQITVVGNYYYENGQQAINNSVDIHGSPINESSFGSSLQISQLQLLGTDASGNGIFGSGGTVTETDPAGNPLFSATITNLKADGTGTGLFDGTLVGASFPGAGSSRMISEWQSDVAGGGTLSIDFDAGAMVANTAGFNASATFSSYIAISAAPVPEPGPVALLITALAGLLAGRKIFRR
jgi:hypothetical protein